MSNQWNSLADEQAKYGNVEPTKETIEFTPRKNFRPAGRTGETHGNGSIVKKSQGLPEYGHMTFLKKLQQDDQEVILITSLGYVIRGFVKAVDEQTLSLKCQNQSGDGLSSEGYRTRILFKSNIIEISPVRGIENLANDLMRQGWVNPLSFSGFGHSETVISPC